MPSFPGLPPRRRRAVIAAAVLALLVATVLFLAPMPDEGESRLPDGADKVAHFLAFLLVATPFFVARLRLWPLIAVVLIAYGGVIELVQPHFGRTAELADVIANSAGVLTALPLAMLIRWRWASQAGKLPQNKRAQKDQ